MSRRDLSAEYHPVSASDGPGYQIDSDIASESTCSECESKPLIWLGFSNGNGSYRAWLVCPKCYLEIEI